LPLFCPCFPMFLRSSAPARQNRQSARLGIHYSPKQAHNTQDIDTHKIENSSSDSMDTLTHVWP
jgi:hypothetical protein